MAQEKPGQSPMFPQPSPFGGYPSPFDLQTLMQSISPNFDTSATPFQFGGQSLFPQQEPVQEGFMPQWGMPPDAGFDPNMGPDMSGMDPGFMQDFDSDPDPGFTPGGKRDKPPTLIPELQDQDILPDDGGPEQYPEFMDFAQQNSPWGDIGIKAAILARGFTNPEQATQWAIALKQRQQQQQFQAYQAAQQQAATRENIKLRNKYNQDQKKQTDFQKRIQKLDSSIRNAKLDPDAIVAKLGPPDEDNIDQWEREIQRGVHQYGVEEKLKKDKSRIIQQAHKSQTDAPQFTDPKSAQYDPVFERNLSAANSLRTQKEGDDRTRNKLVNQLNELRADLLKERTRVEKGMMSDADKAELKAKYEELDTIKSLMDDAAKQASSVDLFAGNDEEGSPQWAAAQEKYNYSNDLVNRRMREYQEKMFEIKEFIGAPKGKGIVPNPTRTLPGTDATGAAATKQGQEAAKANAIGGGQPQPEQAVPRATEAQKANYRKRKKRGDNLEQLNASWGRQFPNDPLPE